MKNAYGIASLRSVPLLIAGIFFASAFYSYSMFHTIVPTSAAFSIVAMCRENGVPDDPDSFLCSHATGTWKPVPYNASPIYAAIAIYLFRLPHYW